MALTARQQLTIEHLNFRGERSAEDIISWCRYKMRLPKRKRGAGGCAGRRKHSKAFYQGIIDALS